MKAYDLAVTTIQRSYQLEVQLNFHKANVLVAYNEEGGVVGYGVLQSLATGPQIGPIYADSQSVGKKLFSSLLAKIPTNAGSKLCIISPDCSREIVLKWAYDFGLTVEEEDTVVCQRMYSKNTIPFKFEKIFATWGFQNNIV